MGENTKGSMDLKDLKALKDLNYHKDMKDLKYDSALTVNGKIIRKGQALSSLLFFSLTSRGHGMDF